MRRNNYETMKMQMQQRFLTYDQGEMIRKFGLRRDGDYLYVSFLGREHRISTTTGAVELAGDGTPADFNAAMTIYDVLCCSKPDCALSGKFCTERALSGLYSGSILGTGLFQSRCEVFDRDLAGFAEACERLGGEKQSGADAAYRFWVFPFLPMELRFWCSDEDFPADLKVFWDENVLDFMHYETIWYAAGYVLERIREEMRH